MDDTSEDTARPAPGTVLNHAAVASITPNCCDSPSCPLSSTHEQPPLLIPVTRTEEKYPEGLPGLPHGKAAQVLAAIPPGCRVADARDAWLQELTASPEYQGARRDQQRNIGRCAEFLSVAMRFDHGIIRPGLVQIRTAMQDVAERTAYRTLRWLRKHHWIVHVQRGSTERYRGVQDGRGNLAAEFVLITAQPAADKVKNGSPSRFPTENRNPSLSREALDNSNSKMEPLRGHHQRPAVASKNKSGLEQEKQTPAWPARRSPTSGLERLRATQTLQQQLPDLRGLSDVHLRSVLRPWYEAGWTNADLHHALDHRPDGRSYTFGGAGHDVRSPEGWIRFRLAPWTTADGDTWSPTLSPTKHRAQQAAAERRKTAAALPAAGEAPASASIRAAAKRALDAILRSRRALHAHTTPTSIALPPTPKAWRNR